jgi:isoquinoline 1-oxidoreductase subunit beta
MLLDRREFLTWTVAGAFVLAIAHAADDVTTEGRLAAWIRIHPDGRVTLYSTVSDMGQGSLTGQIQVLADELDVAWEAVSVEMAPDTEPYRLDGELLTGGSLSVRTRFDLLRKAGAAARAQLIGAAAARWSVPPDRCRAELGYVYGPQTGQRVSYGEVAAAAAAITPPTDPPLKASSAWRYIGRGMAPIGIAKRVNGQAAYGIDVKLPGMLRATLRQCPTLGGTLASLDEAPALAIRGVRKVVRLPGAVAVIAAETWSAFRGAKALAPRWALPTRLTDTKSLPERLRAAYDAADAVVIPREGGKAIRATLRQRFLAGSPQVEATYSLPYLSHSPLEPMNATAHVSATKVEIWAPTQAPTAARKAVAKALGRPLEDVVLHTTLLGGGFGRRLQSDYAVLAALVAREVDLPVQLLWTREEDLTHDYYRPAAVLTYRTVIESDKTIRGFEMIGAAAEDTVFGGAGPEPYALADFAATQTRLETGIRIGAWRSVDASIAVFARESFIDECASAAGLDPLAFRQRLLGDNVRARRLLDAVATSIGWGKPRRSNTGVGLALFAGYDTFVAHAIEVEVDRPRLKVRRIVAAVDPGIVVNPTQVRAQFEGGGLMALGAALAEEVTFTASKADQENFDRYHLLRLPQAPDVEVLLFETPQAKIGGIGEPPVPGVAAALANAVFAATGERVRKLPFATAGFEV